MSQPLRQPSVRFVLEGSVDSSPPNSSLALMKRSIWLATATALMTLCGVAPVLAQSTLSLDDTRYWSSHAMARSGDLPRMARIARSFGQPPLPAGWVSNQPSSPMQLWDFDGDGLLEAYTIGEAAADRDKHALLMAEQQRDGDWVTKKIADVGEFTLLRLRLVPPGQYRTNCNMCSEADRRTVVLDRVGLEYESKPVLRYFAQGPAGLTEVLGTQ